MKGLLLKYNKVHDCSLCNLSIKLSKLCQLQWGDLSQFGDRMDLLSYAEVLEYVTSFGPIDFMVIGDVFWATGQNLCKVGREKNIKIFFLQHGQWIYINNKKELQHYPDHTLVFGDAVKEMCDSWIYGQNSIVSAIGSPRYDDVSFNGRTGNAYVYFSPPVIEEMVHNKPSGRIRSPFLRALERIAGIDREVSLIIQPHYRECRTDLLQKMFPRAEFADPKLDALKLIKGCSKILACRNSTVILDAIAHQKLAVLMDFSEEDVCFFKRGYFDDFAVESDSQKHLVENLLGEQKVNRVDYIERAKKHIYLGGASARIAKLIEV